MRALEIAGLVLSIAASALVIISAPAIRRMYRWVRDAHRRAETIDALAEMHNYPGRSPVGHYPVRGNRVRSL